MNATITRQVAAVTLLLFSVLTYSCSKNNAEDPPSANNQKTITGEWKWIRSVSGWGDIRTANADSTIILKLNTDSSYTVSLNNMVKYTGNFSSTIIPAADSLLVIQFGQNMSVNGLRILNVQAVAYFNNDTCRLYDYGIADGYSHLYYRK